MPFMKEMSRRPIAKEIAAFSDAELTRYMEDVREELNDDVISGWCNAPRHELEWFEKRRMTKIEDPANELPDPDSDLLDFMDAPEPPYRDFLNLTSPDEGRMKREKKSHAELINAGGRPYYSISLARDFERNPHRYKCMLEAWGTFEIFRSQCERWAGFRRWQDFHRGHLNWDEFSSGWPRSAAKDYIQKFGFDDSKLSDYAKALKDLLAKRDVHEKFQLEQDPEQQDRLSTWMEYLGYAAWLYDWGDDVVKAMQGVYDKAWTELIDADVLGPLDTVEDVWGSLRASSDQSGYLSAWHSVKLHVVKAAKLSANVRAGDVDEFSALSLRDRCLRLCRELGEYDFANRMFQVQRKRAKLISKFFEETTEYRRAKNNRDRHSRTLRWSLDQVPLIVVELDEEVNAARGNAEVAPGRHVSPRYDQENEGSTSEAQNSGQGTFFPDNMGFLQTSTGLRRSRDDPADPTPAPKRRRADMQDANYEPNRELTLHVAGELCSANASNDATNHSPRSGRTFRLDGAALHPDRHARLGAC